MRIRKKTIFDYYFLIPSNKLHQALEWMEKRVEIINIENGRKTRKFENWNATSFYLYDASENIAEFIVRHELINESKLDFKISDVLCINKIRIPISNVETANES